MMSISPSTAAPPRPHRLRPTRRLGLAVLVVALAVTALLPWEWSFIDDGGLLTVLHAKQKAYGTLAGIPADIYQMYLTDLSWGLFRPAYWVYCGTFYLLP